MNWELVRPPQKPWLALPLVVAILLTSPLVWMVWNRDAAPPYDPEAMRSRVAILIDATLDHSIPWFDHLPDGPQFDTWLIGLRNEFRPYFEVLSTEFDSDLIFITQEFEANPADSGPFRAHSRQLALVSLRSLLEEEANRLKNPSLMREEPDKRLVKLPQWSFLNDW